MTIGGWAVFDAIKKWGKAVKYALNPVQSISEAIGKPILLSPGMEGALSMWGRMFRDKSPWLFDSEKPAASLGLPASIAAELARLATLECECAVDGSPRAEYLDAQLQRVIDALRAQMEQAIASGGAILKPYVSGGNIVVDFCEQGSFYPVSFDSMGRICGAVFLESLTRGNKLYQRLEYHHREQDCCIIENKAYVTSTIAGGVQLGTPINLTDVPEWAGLEPTLKINGVDRLLIGYFKTPFANHIDKESPLGVSAYSRAVESIKEADRQWARILWEYEAKETAVHADEALFRRNPDTQMPQLPKGKERLYRLIPGGGNDDLWEIFSPDIRDTSLFNGLNNILKRVEFQCSLAYGTLSDPQNVDKTAEEIRASKQRSYTAVKDIQKSLQAALDDCLWAMDIWVSLYNLAPPGQYTATYNWDDSIINDPDAKKQMFWQYVTAGKFPMWRYLVDFEGYSEEDARQLSGDTDLQDPFGFGDKNHADA